MTNYAIADLLKFSHENRPNDFKTAFQSIMKDKISSALDARKEDIAQSMMNQTSGEEDDIDL